MSVAQISVDISSSENSHVVSRVLTNIGKFFLHSLAVFTILVIGAILSSNLILAIAALGYMILAMEKVIDHQGKITVGLPGQDIVARSFATIACIVILFLPVVLCLKAGPPMKLLGLILAIAGFAMSLLGIFAVMLGASALVVWQPKKAFTTIKTYLQQKTLLDDLFANMKNILSTVLQLWNKGVRVFLGAYIVLFVPSFLLAIGWYHGWIFSFERLQPEAGFCVFLSIVGFFMLAWVTAYLPIATARCIKEDSISVFWQFRENRQLIQKTPGYYGLILLLTPLLMLIPYIMRIPRMQPKMIGGIAFFYFAIVLFGKLLWAKAYVRAIQGQGGFFGKTFKNIAAVVSGIAIGLLVLASQFISWRGAYGFFDHFMYLLPTPF